MDIQKLKITISPSYMFIMHSYLYFKFLVPNTTLLHGKVTGIQKFFSGSYNWKICMFWENDPYIYILTVGVGNFVSILCLRYFFLFFTYLNIIKIISVVNVNFSKKTRFFRVQAALNGLQAQVSRWKTYFFLLNFRSRVQQHQLKQFRNKVHSNICAL